MLHGGGEILQHEMASAPAILERMFRAREGCRRIDIHQPHLAGAQHRCGCDRILHARSDILRRDGAHLLQAIACR